MRLQASEKCVMAPDVPEKSQSTANDSSGDVAARLPGLTRQSSDYRARLRPRVRRLMAEQGRSSSGLPSLILYFMCVCEVEKYVCLVLISGGVVAPPPSHYLFLSYVLKHTLVLPLVSGSVEFYNY